MIDLRFLSQQQRDDLAEVLTALAEAGIEVEADTHWAPSIYLFVLHRVGRYTTVRTGTCIRVSNHPPALGKFDPHYSVHPGADPAAVVARRFVRLVRQRAVESQREKRAAIDAQHRHWRRHQGRRA